jgi:hypothetical protein
MFRRKITSYGAVFSYLLTVFLVNSLTLNMEALRETSVYVYRVPGVLSDLPLAIIMQHLLITVFIFPLKKELLSLCMEACVRGVRKIGVKGHG